MFKVSRLTFFLWILSTWSCMYTYLVSEAAVPTGWVQTCQGRLHMCGRTAEGAVKCIGNNRSGNLGLGNSVPTGYMPENRFKTPQAVDLGTDKFAKDLQCGYDFTCVLRNSNDVVCWGNNTYGQLGRGSTVYGWGDYPNEMGDNLWPVALPSGRSAKALSTIGESTVIIVADNNTLYCFGRNEGACGLGTTSSALEKIGDSLFELGNSFIQTNVGYGSQRIPEKVVVFEYHSCMLTTVGTVYCWGKNDKWQLGLSWAGVESVVGDEPGEMGMDLDAVQIPFNGKAKKVVLGSFFTCLLTTSNDLYCFGDNYYGQHGIGSYTTSGKAIGEKAKLGTGKYAVDVCAGKYFTCVLRNTGDVVCFGDNTYGQLGVGHATNYPDWGDESDEVGDNFVPVDLGSGRTATKIQCGRYHACAFLDNGEMVCWGRNDYGHLGIGDHRGMAFKRSRIFNDKVIVKCKKCN